MTWQDYAVVTIGILVAYSIVRKIVRMIKSQQKGESPCSSCSGTCTRGEKDKDGTSCNAKG